MTDVDEAMVERIGEAELAIMDVLWAADGALTAAEVTQLSAARRWSESTVKTMLSRLAAKGAITHETRGRTFFWRPAVERGAYATTESRRLLDRLFKGRVAPLVAHLAEAETLTEADIAELEALLKDLRR